ncbi:DUF5808 domain-containing protein [Staphylococcus chromogenes]|nr:DUF5808 domain-containing protein [Staphylococcus chromogenes]
MNVVLALANAIVPLAALLWRHDERPLGVDVPMKNRDHSVVTRSVRAFRRAMLALAAGFFLFSLLLGGKALILTPFTLVPVIAANAHFGGAIKRVKRAEDWYADTPVLIDGDVVDRPYQSYPYSLLGYFAAVAFLLAGSAYLAAHWAEIPETFATHFSGDFEPDGWSHKTIGGVFTGMFISAGSLVSFALISLLSYQLARENRAPLDTPRGRRAARMAADAVTALGWFGALMSGFITALQICMALPQFQHFIPAMTISLLLSVIGGSLVMIAWIMLRAEQAGAPAAGDAPSYDAPDRDRFYKWGMFYYNPDDPAVMVEKRVGVGTTFNFARWQAQLAMAVLLLVSFVPLVVIAVSAA